MQTLFLDPTLKLNIDFINPGIACAIRVSGAWLRDGKISYFDENVTVPGGSTVITNVVLPCYSDQLIGISIYHRPTYIAGFGCYAHAYLKSGDVVDSPRVIDLCSGWVSNARPLSFPPTEDQDSPDALAPLILRQPIPVPGNDVACATPIEEKSLCVGFRGTFTADATIINRQVGLAINDGLGGQVNSVIEATLIPALASITLYGFTGVFAPFAIGLNLYVPIPNVIFNDEFPLSTITTNIQALDLWSNVEYLIRPYIVH